jgi:hypothetical protein
MQTSKVFRKTELVIIIMLTARSWLPAEGWKTCDTFQLAESFPASAQGIIHNPASGELIVAGSGGTDLNRCGVIRRGTSAQGWDMIFSDSVVDSADATFQACAVDKLRGYLYIGGHYVIAQELSWFIMQSRNGGQDWEIIDSFTTARGVARCGSIAVDSRGNVYAAGYVAHGSTLSWITRKGSFDPSSGWRWNTVDEIGRNGGNWNESSGICMNQADDVFVSGYIGSSDNQQVWSVRRSTEKGRTWNTVDSLPVPVGNSRATAIAADAAGAIYAAGLVVNCSYVPARQYWIVRKSVDRGETWSIVDTFRSDLDCVLPAAIGFDGSGGVFVGGSVESLNQEQWIVRHGRPVRGKLVWATSDCWQMAPGLDAAVKAIATGPGGYIYASGFAESPEKRRFWVTRRLSVSPPSLIAYGESSSENPRSNDIR